MTTKADFNAEEWSLILEAGPTAAMVVIRANKGGTIRESLAIGKVNNEARQAQGQSELLGLDLVRVALTSTEPDVIVHGAAWKPTRCLSSPRCAFRSRP